MLPVTYPSFIEYKYASARSSALPNLFVSVACFMYSSASSGTAESIEVLTDPGDTQLTRTGARSTARPRATPSCALLYAAAIVHPAAGLVPTTPLVTAKEESGEITIKVGMSFARMSGVTKRTLPAFWMYSGVISENGFQRESIAGREHNVVELMRAVVGCGFEKTYQVSLEGFWVGEIADVALDPIFSHFKICTS